MSNNKSVLELAHSDFVSSPACGLSFESVLANAKETEARAESKRPFRLLYGSLIFAALVGIVVPTAVHFSNAENTALNPSVLRQRMLKAGEEYFRGNILPDGLSIGDDYGIFGKCYVGLFFGTAYAERLSKETIVSVSFFYPNTNTIMAFDSEKNELRTLTGAYCDLWLDQKELGSIREKQRENYSWLYEKGKPEDFFEINQPAITLQKKEKWDRAFAPEDSLESIDVTIDPVFNSHVFSLDDFKYDGFSKLTILSSESLTLRLELNKGGKDSVITAISAIENLDFVEAAKPGK
jgi:hypothetical protein